MFINISAVHNKELVFATFRFQLLRSFVIPTVLIQLELFVNCILLIRLCPQLGEFIIVNTGMNSLSVILTHSQLSVPIRYCENFSHIVTPTFPIVTETMFREMNCSP